MSSKEPGWPWAVLDLPKAPQTSADVRRAYARKLKTIDQATDIAGFEALRAAYEFGLMRVEQSARKKAARAAAKAAGERDSEEPGVEESDGRPPLPDGPPAQPVERPVIAASRQLKTEFLPAGAPASAAARLDQMLAGLEEQNILLSTNQRIVQLLGDNDFHAPEHDATLRRALSHYLLSQLLFDHLNDPYLRHPGLSPEVLRALDARYGWLSDYTAFRADFGNHSDLLEALVSAAELERRPSVGDAGDPVPIRGSRLYVVLGALGLFVLWTKMGDLARDAEPGSALSILSQVLSILGPGAFLAGSVYVLYNAILAHAPRWVAILGTAWAVLGFLLLVLPIGILPKDWSVLSIWGYVTVAAGVGFSCLWFGRKAMTLLRRLRQRS